jgi:hypothetical protein
MVAMQVYLHLSPLRMARRLGCTLHVVSGAIL